MHKRLFAPLVLLVLLATPSWPQASTATVGGTVRDTSAAVVPACEVVLTNTATNNVSRTRTNDAGYYFFAGIIPGPYRLRIEQSGMQTYEATVQVQVQQSVVVDPVLQVGQTSTAIEVKDATPMMTVDNPTIGHVLERQRIEQLPINGRSVITLFQTIPGMEGYRAYGLREGSGEITLDGAALVDKSRGQSTYRAPGLDTIQEFKAEVNSASARYTRPTTVVLSTKSGTNQLHGTLFETHRNNAIGKARMRQDGNTAPKLIRNEFGGTAGGPVVLPKVYDGRNRTFWFASYEGYRLVAPSTGTYKVPTEAMRNGDFSGLVDNQGRLTAIYDPWSTDTNTWTRQPFNYGGKLNAVDPKRQSPLSKYLDSIIPLPTNANSPMLDYNWSGPIPNTSRQWTMSARFDHRFSDKDNVYFRYTQSNYRDYQVNGVPTSDGGANNQVTDAPNKSGALSWVRTISPTLFNELLISGAYENWYIGGATRDTDFAAQLGLPNPFNSTVFPQIVSNGFFAYQPINARAAASTYFILDDNVTKVHGKHQFEFGGHARMDMVNMLPDQQQASGSVNALPNYTGLYDPATPRANPGATRYTGNLTASLYLGLINDKNVLNRGNFYGRSKEYALYFQDTYKVTSRLTLRLGLRWEYWPAYSEKNNLMLGFSREQRAVILGTSLENMYNLGATFPSIPARFLSLGGKFTSYEQAGLGQSMQNANGRNFGPRLGFAYRALEGRREFVIRGGFSTSYWTIPMRVWGSNVKSSVPLRGEFSYNPDDSAQSPDGGNGWSLRSVPTVIAGVNTRNIIDLNNTRLLTRGSSFGLAYFLPDNPTPRTHNWNMTVEKQILSDTVVKASYIGSNSYGLEEWYQYNDATPNYVWYMTTGQPLPTGEYSGVATRGYDQTVYGNLKEYHPTGWANFHGAQVELQRRYSKGVGFQIFYVMSNALKAGGDTASSVVWDQYMFLPGEMPADYKQRDRLLNYRRDDAIPKHRLRWNWIVDLPVGKNRLIARNAGRLIDKFIGGWQLAGMGSLGSSYFQLPDDRFPTGAPVEVYGYKYPIEDCRGGNCIPGYLWWNGYIPANQINSYDPKTGRPNGVMGVPDNYKPAVQPLIPWPAVPDPKDPNYAFYGTNTVWVPLKNGTTQRLAYTDNYPALNNQFFQGNRVWSLDASLVKNIPFHERYNLRFQADFFNVLNHPNNQTGIGAEGILQTRFSGNAARQLQLSLRLSW